MWKYIRQDDGLMLAMSQCQDCGKWFSGGNVAVQQRCPDCQKVHKRELARDRVRRFRARQKSNGVISNEED